MPITDRRTLLRSAAALPLATAAANMALAQGSETTSGAAAKPAPAKDVTRTLAHYLVTASYDDLPANVRKEGMRTLLNWVGVAVGGTGERVAVGVGVAAGAPPW